jgi:hypothetical protein
MAHESLDQVPVRLAAFEERQVLVEIAPIGAQRVQGEAALDAEGNQILLDTFGETR